MTFNIKFVIYHFHEQSAINVKSIACTDCIVIGGI